MEMWGVSVCPLAWTGMLGWGHKARRQIHRWGEHTVLVQIQIQIQTQTHQRNLDQAHLIWLVGSHVY